MEIVKIILSNLITNDQYFVKVWPYLKTDYFEAGPAKNIFKLLQEHVDQYHTKPSKEALNVALENSTLSQTEMKGAQDLKNSLPSSTVEDREWLIRETENYVKKSAMFNATSKIIEIQTNADLPRDKRDKRMPDVGAIPDIMREALSVCFDSDLGHDWADDYEERWLSYVNKTRKVPFKIPILNKITKGGAERKTLNILMSPSNVGKSLGLCSLAADYLQTGLNVLYITMEMAEEVVAKRIDSNLLDVSLDDIDDLNISYAEYKSKMERWRKNGALGRLKIKQYPTGGANADTFRALLNEYKLKEGFIPDVIIVDYLGICSSSRMKSYSENSYIMVKAIAEELRGLAVDTDTMMWSAAQTGRAAFDASDVSSQDVAESIGLVATVDFMLAVIETEELAKQGIQVFKQLKSRYGDKNYIKTFQMKVKKGNQRWVQMDDSEYRQNTEVNTNIVKPPSNEPSSSRAKIDDLIEDLKFD